MIPNGDKKRMTSSFALRSMLGTAGALLLLADVAGEDDRAADACGEQGAANKS
jgi:hypothetical protein